MQPVGIRTNDGIVEVLPSTTKIGEEVTVPFHFFPSSDYAKELLVSFFQGDWERFEGQSSLGTVKIVIPHPDKQDKVCITLILSYNEDCLICLKALLNNKVICSTMIHDRWHNANPYYRSQNMEEEEILITNIRTLATNSPEGEQVIRDLITLQNKKKSNLISTQDYVHNLYMLYNKVISYLRTA